MDQEYATKIAERFGPRLKELRAAAGLTQAGLAEIAGLRQASIADYERGKTSAGWPQVVRLAHALGVTPDTFLREATPDKNQNSG
ncbi:helix-turn-helix domain-containing protein [Gemmata sp.]|uniref:helix-turn-helix domain-containing protein n=1 Tax=Gemmata sp. TaxID=1914242 RepID=UPI003F6E851D